MSSARRHRERRAFVPAAALVLALALGLGPTGANATVLYKSIGPHGVIQFSDTPPTEGSVVEIRIVSDAAPGGQPVGANNLPLIAFENPLGLAAEGVDPNDALVRANAQVDLAEHQLALARNDTWEPREGLRLGSPRRAPGDDERIAFYERNLAAARAGLLAAMRNSQDSGTDAVIAPTQRGTSTTTRIAQR